ncbi:MAG TPA: DNA/RNA non-specific endonuclease [Candidatus Kapabacteria bacterium]|nr:DNA/RNA non-specific endonuclease [Candidatus Kapabacteria bacterium]
MNFVHKYIMKYNRLKLLLLISIFITDINVTLSNDCYKEIHTKHFFGGMPQGVPATNDLIIRDSYCLSSNDSTKLADWVAYMLDIPTMTGTSIDRKWAADPWLDDSETLEPDDYTGANKAYKYDRGHQAPLANFKGNRDIETTNYLSNITPQKAELNQGAWKNLEDNERSLTQKYGLIYVMTGPIYNSIQQALLPSADESHKVPSDYWKIIIIPLDNVNFKVFAFLFSQNTPRKSPIAEHLVTIKEVEKKSKLSFFSELDSKIKKNIDNYIDKKWFLENFK